MSLALDPQVQSHCRRLAFKYGGRDREDAYQLGLAVVIEHESRGRQWAMDTAAHRVWSAMRSRIRAERMPRLYRDWRASVAREPVDAADVPDMLARLTPRQREAVRLRLWEGLSESECGERMGCRPNTATKYYWDAIARLRSFYGAV